MEINQRIKYLRKNHLKLTQQEFADKIMISRSNLGNIETGKVAATDRVIASICDEFHVNERWLRDGSGDIYMNLTTRDEIILRLSKVMESGSEDFINRFASVLCKLEESDWELLATVAENLVNRKKEG